jgi:hypothetical protein
MLCVVYAECRKQAYNAECNAECHYAECHYAECHYAEFRGAATTLCIMIPSIKTFSITIGETRHSAL